MSKLATIRPVYALIPLLSAAMLVGVLVLALLPYVWFREVTAPAAAVEEMDWLDD